MKYEIAQIFYDWYDNIKDVFQRPCENYAYRKKYIAEHEVW